MVLFGLFYGYDLLWLKLNRIKKKRNFFPFIFTKSKQTRSVVPFDGRLLLVFYLVELLNLKVHCLQYGVWE